MKKIVYCLLLLIVFTSCSKDDESTPKVKTCNFTSAEEFLENPSVKNALNAVGVSVNKGDNPPVLSGEYDVNGYIVKTGKPVTGLTGTRINSQFNLYNQTSLGKISFSESVGNIQVQGSGGFITGQGNKFTIWQESRQNGAEAGLPDGMSVNVVLVMLGNKLSNGDLSAKGISIITNATSSDPDYQIDEEVLSDGELYWMWDADFILDNNINSERRSNVINSPIYNINDFLLNE